MEATEFRIGNLIYKYGTDYTGDNPCVDWSDKEIIKVDLAVLKNIQDFNGTTDYYYTDGIELTEEILLKCGFEQSDNDLFELIILENSESRSDLWALSGKGCGVA